MRRLTLHIEAAPDWLAVTPVETAFRRRTVGERVTFPLPPAAFGDGQAMAAPLSAWLRGHAVPPGVSAVVYAYTRRTVIRLTSLPDREVKKWSASGGWPRAYFPYGDALNHETHVFSAAPFPGPEGYTRVFMAALPLSIAESLVSLCHTLSVRPHKLLRIDTAEHALFRQYTGAGDAALCLPMDGGFRWLFLRDGQPWAAYFTGNGPATRENELTRLWQTLDTRPVSVLSPPGEAWLGDYFKEQWGISCAYAQLTACPR